MGTDSHLETLSQPGASANRGLVAGLIFSSPFFLFALDLVVGLLAYFAAWLVRIYVSLPLTQELLPQERFAVVEHPWLLLGLSQAFFLFVFGLYDDLRDVRHRELLTYLFAGVGLQILTVTAVIFLSSTPEQVQEVIGIFPRSVLLLFGGLNFLGLAAWRFVVKARLLEDVSRVIIAGPNASAVRQVLEELSTRTPSGFQIVGVMFDRAEASGKEDELFSYPRLGRLDQAKQLIDEYGVDQIIFAPDTGWRDRLLHSLSESQLERPLRIAIQPSVFEIAIGRLQHINIHDTPLIEVRRNPNEPLQRFSKRAFDILVSLVSLVVLSPLLLVVSLLIKFLSPGPIFYTQTRVGRGGHVFRLIKFRSMIPDAEKHTGARYADREDPRVTLIGRYLRRFRIDELPQLINVFKGEMSFVGPRPERPEFVDRFARELTGYNERHKVKPGITGLAQVRSFYDTTAENKLKYDLAYIYNFSFSLDLLILLETLKVVLVRRGS